ncbi:CBS domain-containing protein [Nocardia grenadensis]|uniref:CBS domain-containing protein n=1 Tax=Nocardia grenadensis TaxID=931537 RepID=UPI003D723681
MTTQPTAVRDAWTIDELVRSDILRRIRHGVFPVVDGEARPVGILTWPPLTGVLSADRETTIVGRIARPPARGGPYAPGRAAGRRVLPVLLRPDTGLITALDGRQSRLAVVTATDVTRACQRSALGIPTRVDSRIAEYRPSVAEAARRPQPVGIRCGGGRRSPG